jgi:hypothetical protein
MSGETDLRKLLKSIKPKHNPGDFVFCSVSDFSQINPSAIVSTFKEQEGITIIIKKELADQLVLPYSFVASWITLTVHSSLEAVGLTSAFSTALAQRGIGCNVIAAFYHDHLFVNKKDAAQAMEILNELSG